MAEQLIFDWPTGVALGDEDFFVAGPNAQAYAMIANPDGWPEGKLVLVGPEGAGKSHLARVFAAARGARVLTAQDLASGTDPNMDCPAVIEDADRLTAGAEEALFHLHNNLRAARLPLLLTARTPPARWTVGLADLASRLQATAIARIADPDDALLEAVLMKHFADRQLPVKPTLIAYLLPRIERSFAAAADIVASLDAEALRQGKPVGRGLAARLLDNPADPAR